MGIVAEGINNHGAAVSDPGEALGHAGQVLPGRIAGLKRE